MSEWIFVDDQLPDPGDQVVAYFPWYDTVKVMEYTPEPEHGYTWDAEESPVSHWMPIPDFPEA